MITAICRAYLAVLSAYHIATGLLSFGFPRFAMRFYKTLYGCDPVERRQLSMVMKPWGALAVFAGICGGLAAADPVRYRGIVCALWFLLVLRAGYRLFCRRELEAVGRIPPRRNAISIVSILLGIAILSVWLGLAWEATQHD